MTLNPVHVSFLNGVWPGIREGVAHTLNKVGDRALPEDIYMELKALTAFLYMIEDGTEELGFMVCRRVMDPDGAVLFVWLMYTEPGSMMQRRDEILKQIDELARGIGAKRIRHYSPRGGFAEDGAFTLKMHIYEREV